MNIVIVEDSELIQVQLIRLLAKEPRIHVDGVADQEEGAIEMILSCNPDAVLLDLSLSPGSGLRVLQRIRLAGNRSRVLVLSNQTEASLRTAAETLGISGFFDKNSEISSCLERLISWLPHKELTDKERLDTLLSTGLIDGSAQDVFDDIAKMARNMTGTPIGTISLVGAAQQWMLCKQTTELLQSTTPLDFCRHAIRSDALMEVPDALLDSRFSAHPMVVDGPKIRFYAGVPLVLMAGETLGTLCVFDTVPRKLSIEQKQGLKNLAHCVVTEIELRRRLHHLAQNVPAMSALST